VTFPRRSPRNPHGAHWLRTGRGPYAHTMSQPVALGEDPSRSAASAIPDIDERVLQLFAIVTDNLAGASQAFLSDDREAARALVAADQRVDSMEQDLLRLIDQRVVASPPPSAATRTARSRGRTLQPDVEAGLDGSLLQPGMPCALSMRTLSTLSCAARCSWIMTASWSTASASL